MIVQAIVRYIPAKDPNNAMPIRSRRVSSSCECKVPKVLPSRVDGALPRLKVRPVSLSLVLVKLLPGRIRTLLPRSRAAANLAWSFGSDGADDLSN